VGFGVAGLKSEPAIAAALPVIPMASCTPQRLMFFLNFLIQFLLVVERMFIAVGGLKISFSTGSLSQCEENKSFVDGLLAAGRICLPAQR
jgi:hypothetical protein